jgi:hypothetical protein
MQHETKQRIRTKSRYCWNAEVIMRSADQGIRLSSSSHKTHHSSKSALLKWLNTPKNLEIQTLNLTLQSQEKGFSLKKFLQKWQVTSRSLCIHSMLNMEKPGRYSMYKELLHLCELSLFLLQVRLI